VHHLFAKQIYTSCENACNQQTSGRIRLPEAKKTGHAVKKTSKKVTHKAAKATRKGAEKVEDKTAQ